MNPYEYAAAHRQEFLAELMDWIRIPSITTLAEHKGDIRRAADWLKSYLIKMGMTRADVYETAGNPVVYAEWLGADDAPTVLIYGHYDVQPADDPDNQWKTDPFDPVIIGDNLYARGATDDKGQTFVQITAIQSLLAAGNMPVNVKFLIEGEEEAGSKNLAPFIDSHVDMLAADVIVVSDTNMLGLDRPSIVYGLRGLVFLEIEVWGPSHDLHSGMYGGAVHNPAQALIEILASMHDDNGTITIPGFYDRVLALGEDERTELAKTPLTFERLQAETGISKAWGEKEYDIHERIAVRPTLEICGLVSGWTGEGGKTAIPSKALAKVSCRLVPEQNPDEIEALIRRYVASVTPDTVRSEVRGLQHGGWVMMDLHSPYMQAAIRAYEFGFGSRPVFMREGGSIAAVGSLQQALNAPAILMGFGLPDDNLHGPNEKFTLECFDRGQRTALKFYQDIGALKA